jgi:hypothetical protein
MSSQMVSDVPTKERFVLDYENDNSAQACELRNRLMFNDVASVQFRTLGMAALRFKMAWEPGRRRVELQPAANFRAQEIERP